MAAWSFDRAVFLFGTSLEAELDRAEQGAKSDTQRNGRRQQVMARWLGTKVQYKSPAVAKAAGGDTVSSAASAGPVSL